MLLTSLLITPLIGVMTIVANRENGISLTNVKIVALSASILNFFISLVIFILFDFSTNQFQFVQECYEVSYFDFYLGVDGLSIYFILLTTIIMPISLLSNWKSISKDVVSYVIIILLLESLLLAVFLVLDTLLFYIFFESILPPLFILIGIFGSDNRVKASFYLFLYTLLGSLFLLLSILAMSSIMSTTDFDTLFKGNFIYITQLFLFYGIFIAFAVKTPTIFLNTWLLKAHVESPLGGSIILAAIVLKLSLYGILRLILPILPKAYMEYTYIIFLIGVITIVYASLSTLRTIDIKELIAYSSVSHAAVYLLGVFSNSIQGIQGAITLGLAHGFVSPGLFICAGGVLYDRSHTRVISFYRGVTQVMPLFAILFFILCLANCGAPLTLNFIGEFLSLYGVFERSSLYGLFASSSIIFSAAYTIYMFQRIAFGGAYSRMFTVVMADLTKREFTMLMLLAVPTVTLGIYPALILDGLAYGVSLLLYSSDPLDYSLIGFFSATFVLHTNGTDENINIPIEHMPLKYREDCTGRWAAWRNYNMSPGERYQWAIADYDYYCDLLTWKVNKKAARFNLRMLERELPYLKYHADMDYNARIGDLRDPIKYRAHINRLREGREESVQQVNQQNLNQVRWEEPVQQVNQQNLNPARQVTIQSLLNQQDVNPVRQVTIQSLLNQQAILVITATRVSVSLFVKNMLMYLKPLLRAIIPLTLLPLFWDHFLLITEVYNVLANILNEYCMYAISMLFWILLFLFRLLLVIRRANNSIGLYDKLFSLKAENYLSGILYFFILVLSVGLVYLCGCDPVLV